MLVPAKAEMFTIPRYVRDVSELITLGITSAQLVTMVPSEFGKMCLNISRQSDAPSVLTLESVELLSCERRHAYPSRKHKREQEGRHDSYLLRQVKLEQNRYYHERYAGKYIRDSVHDKIDVAAVVTLDSSVNRTDSEVDGGNNNCEYY